ncbi:MAG: DUF4382 domain-containing protein [Flavisolibacter sp.]
MKRTPLFFTLAAAAVTLFYACTKNDVSAENKAHLQVYLTDLPGNYDEVNIDVKDVMINYQSDSGSGWKSLPGVKAGSYDILELTNGNDALLADAEIETGSIKQIRLILGDNNYVTVDGDQFDLKTPSAQQSGLKINLNQDVNEGVTYKLLLDFDASRSIVRTGNGGYILKPVIRATVEAVGGTIRGFVTPDTLATSVYAIQGSDTVAGTTTSAGGYQLRGVNAGTYQLSFVPSDTAFKAQTKTGITVTANQVTVVDTVHLVK